MKTICLFRRPELKRSSESTNSQPDCSESKLSELRYRALYSAFAVLAIIASIERSRMSASATALLVVDVQESFRHRPYWRDSELPFFVECLRSLIAGAQSRKIPVV